MVNLRQEQVAAEMGVSLARGYLGAGATCHREIDPIAGIDVQLLLQ